TAPHRPCDCARRVASHPPSAAADRIVSGASAPPGPPARAAQIGRGRLHASLLNRRMLVCLFMGFSSGLPFFVTSSLLPAWLRSEGASLRDIGLFALAGAPYTWKFAWAPLLDRFVPPFLDRRRGWALAAQIG